MKIAVTGALGTVGSELVRRGAVPISSDILNAEQIAFEIAETSPDVIFHCAAATDVEWCEKNPKEAFAINAKGVGNVVDGFRGHFIYLSSDHIFNGYKGWKGYSEKDKPKPINQYGATKWAGELVSSYGVSESHIIRSSKVLTYKLIEPELRRMVVEAETLEFSDVLFRSFIHVRHFVESLLRYVSNIDKMPGILNIAGRNSISYYHMWLEIANVFNLDQRRIVARKVPLDEATATPRPLHAGLNIYEAKRLGLPIYSAHQAAKELWDDFQEAQSL